jgi:hypothetical protein
MGKLVVAYRPLAKPGVGSKPRVRPEVVCKQQVRLAVVSNHLVRPVAVSRTSTIVCVFDFLRGSEDIFLSLAKPAIAGHTSRERTMRTLTYRGFSMADEPRRVPLDANPKSPCLTP